jgi:hypothetical protein
MPAEVLTNQEASANAGVVETLTEITLKIAIICSIDGMSRVLI